MMNQTTNYKQFEYALNRPLDTKRTEKLASAIIGIDLGELYPITVKEQAGKFIIVDGQHRFHVRSALGLPIFYVIANDSVTIDNIRIAESMHKDWSGNDYVFYYALQGKPDYIRLLNLIKSTGWAASNLLLGRGWSVPIKTGDLKLSEDDIAQMKVAIHYYERLTMKFTFQVDRRIFFSTCIKLTTKIFDLTVLEDKVYKYRTMVYPCQKVEQYLKMLQDVYNYKQKTLKATLIEL